MDSQSSSETPTRTIKTNVSVNQVDLKTIALTYTVNSAKASDCRFSWEVDKSGDFYGLMKARDGSTLYTHTFSKPVPKETVKELGQPGKSKESDKVIFKFKRPTPTFSFEEYVRRQ